MNLALAVAAAYLIGSIPFAIISSHLFRLGDPRQYGSGNPGATNVLRSGNKLAAALTLLGDAGKGWFVVWFATHHAPVTFDSASLALLAFAAFVGHVFSCFLSFKGGKGVATALGVLLGLNWMLALAVLSVWLLTVVIWRYSSLGAIVAAIATPGLGLWLADDPAILIGLLPMSLILLWRHKANIERLRAGSESRIGSKKG